MQQNPKYLRERFYKRSFSYENKMAEKAHCEICDKTFKDTEGLAQHKAAKHSERLENINSTTSNPGFNFKK
jgi:hypothetical protein